LNVQVATLDFAEDRDGRLWFLDFNPNGQFLYLEEVNPELPLLRTAVEGLTGGRRPGSPSMDDISYARFLEEGFPAVREACEQSHDMLPLPVRKTYSLTDLVDG